MNNQTTSKSLPCFRGRACTLSCSCDQQLRRCADAVFRNWNLRDLQCSLYAFSCVFSAVTLGTWTYIFQGLLVLTLMILRKKFVPQYLFSFVVGFVFGELLDVQFEMWINVLPTAIGWRVLYFVASYILICIGIALSNRCQMPIVPTDLFSKRAVPDHFHHLPEDQDQL